MTISAPQRLQGMGAMPHESGVAFRVWAPHADIETAGGGDEYKFVIRNGEQTLRRIDPYARQVTNSVGNAVVHEPDFDWGDDHIELPPWNELVIYEMHVGTFGRKPGQNGGHNSNLVLRGFMSADVIWHCFMTSDRSVTRPVC